MSRFDYVKYDDIAASAQERLKALYVFLENEINSSLRDGRAKALVLTKLEESFMWCGKAIRDDQLGRNGTVELQK